MMRIGIDFDNTIVCYEGVFYLAAKEKGALPSHIPDSKDAIRDHFRSVQKEALWTEIQGYVYGSQMDLAKPFPDIDHFFDSCQNTKKEVFIISHKTRHPYLGPPYDLHQSALNWLQKRPFLVEIPTFFEPTLREKLERIQMLQCDVFIDDLPEVLLESRFPSGVKKILFDPLRRHPPHPAYLNFSSWKEISRHFGFAHG